MERFIKESNERGMSLIEVLVALGLLAAVSTAMMMSYGQMQWAQLIVDTNRSHLDYEQVLRATVSTELLKYMRNAPNACTGAPLVITQTESSGSVAIMQVTTTTAVPTFFSGGDAGAGAYRCQHQPFRTAGLNANDFYICLKFDFAGSQSFSFGNKKSSLSNSKKVFAEVQISFVDFSDSAPAACSDFKTAVLQPNRGSAGATVAYSLYWEVASSDNKRQKSNRKNGILYVAAR